MRKDDLQFERYGRPRQEDEKISSESEREQNRLGSNEARSSFWGKFQWSSRGQKSVADRRTLQRHVVWDEGTTNRKSRTKKTESKREKKSQRSTSNGEELDADITKRGRNQKEDIPNIKEITAEPQKARHPVKQTRMLQAAQEEEQHTKVMLWRWCDTTTNEPWSCQDTQRKWCSETSRLSRPLSMERAKNSRICLRTSSSVRIRMDDLGKL